MRHFTQLRHDHASIRADEVGDRPALGVQDLRPDRHGELDALPVGAVPARAPAVAAAPCAIPRLAAERAQVAEMLVGLDRDVAAAAAVAAVRAAARHVLLAAEAETAIAAIPRAQFDVDFVNEHGRSGRVAARTPRLVQARPTFRPWCRPGRY